MNRPQCIALTRDGSQCKNQIFTSNYDAYCAVHRVVSRRGEYELWLMGPKISVKDGQYLIFQIMGRVEGKRKLQFGGHIMTRNEPTYTELETVDFEPSFRGKRLSTWAVTEALRVALDRASTPRKCVKIYLSPEKGFKHAARRCYLRSMSNLGYAPSTQRRANARGDLLMTFKKVPGA